jgi:class 3 adenylate cyclase/tetratricopeptide (TPR) repeat protein
MQCSKCEHVNRIGARFCEECGRPLARTCPNCKTQVRPLATACHECSHPLSTEAQLSRFRSPEVYAPGHLAEKIRTSKPALQGERKQITVLFADLKDSTQLISGRDPEDARELLDPVLDLMMAAVHRYEGTVNQVMSDGIMALFGAPVAHEDHAVRACFAALRMQESVKSYSEQVRRTRGFELQIRIGLNSGEVMVGSVGTDLRMNYTAIGLTTQLAARMEQIADAGTILTTRDTRRLVEGYVQFRPIGATPIKGLDAPVEIFEVTGPGLAGTRLQALTTRNLSRFVGREAEVLELGRAVEAGRSGRGQIIAVVGEAGVGKSRLYWEFTRSHLPHDWLILETGTVSYRKASAYLPIITLLKAWFQIEAEDGVGSVRDKVTAKLASLDNQLAASALLSLLDVPVDDPHWHRLDPPQRRQQTLDAIKRLLVRQSEVRPLLVLVEDLHWIDTETQALLDAVVDALPTARLLLVVTYRPEYAHSWGSKSYYRQLRIDPLPKAMAEDLLTTLLGTDAGLAELKRTLTERTEGNPLFLEESVHTLVESKALIGEPHRYCLADEAQTIQVPATVQAIIAARIDRLSRKDKDLLQAASVIGKDVPLTLLQSLANLNKQELQRALTHLQSAEFLYATNLENEYTFKHALTHQVAYEGLLRDRRRALHALVTEVIERLSGERVVEHAERLAHHALRGELWEKAAAHLRQTGLRAIERGTLREAVAHLEQALLALRRLPETRGKAELIIDIRIDLRNALYPSGDWARMGEHLHEAELLARSLGDMHRLGRIMTFMVPLRRARGDYAGAIDSGQEALKIAGQLGDRSIEVVATSYLGFTHLARGEFSEAASLFERNVALQSNARGERLGTAAIQLAVSKAWLADVLSELGRFDEAVAHGEAAVHIAEAADHPHTLYFSSFDIGLVHLRRGGFERAIQYLKRGFDLCSASRDVVRMPLFAAALGAAYTLADRGEEALALVMDAVEEFHRHQVHFRPAFILLCAGMTCLSSGRIDEATSHAREALALAQRLGARASEAHALCLNGDVAATRGADDPDGYYHQALALGAPRGMHPLVAHCHFGLGKLHRRTGKNGQAQEELTIAMAMYRKMDMTYWLERADAEINRPG